MQSISSRIWTRATVSISYDDNHYTTATSNYYDVTLTFFFNICHFLAHYEIVLHISFMNEELVANFIFKWVRTNL